MTKQSKLYKIRKRSVKDIEDVIEPYPIRKNSFSLFDGYPDVAKEWLYSKNCGFGPEDFSYGSNVRAWWKCSNKGCKHIWKTSIASRTTLARGCFRCNLGEQTDLRDYPLALAQFDWKKNKDIDPYKLPWHTIVFWDCKNGRDHKWQSTFNRSTNTRCPFCKNHRVSYDNCLLRNKRLAKEFDRKLNTQINPKEISLHSKEIYWWRCPKADDHVWQAVIGERHATGSGCPFCINHRASKSNSLATLYPEVAKSWHPTKNKPITPDMVPAGSNAKYWWKCDAASDHVWQAHVYSRTTRGAGCPFCSNRMVSKTNSLAKLYPKLMKEWHPVKNGNLNPSDLTSTSNERVWWQCLKCSREWQTRIDFRTVKGQGCSSCNRRKSRITDEQIKLALKLSKQGKSIKDIAIIFDVHWSTLYRVLHKQEKS